MAIKLPVPIGSLSHLRLAQVVHTPNQDQDALYQGVPLGEEDDMKTFEIFTNHKPKQRIYPKFIFILCIIFLPFLIVSIMAEKERYYFSNAPPTLEFYQTSEVCVVNETDNLKPEFIFSTVKIGKGYDVDDTDGISYDGVNSYRNTSLIAHCGKCGMCSNAHDIRIYDETKNTLTRDSTSCAKRVFLGGSKEVAKCFHEKVGFTSSCQECWVENVMCDLRNCIFTCLKHGFLNGGRSAGTVEGGQTNPCLECDEKMCGREFIKCAGANRRRSGIVSDIERDDDKELCKIADFINE